jgi:hypothetical protein
MNERTLTTSGIRRPVKRRGLMAGVAALGGALISELLGSNRMEAGHDGTNVLHLGLVTAANNVAGNRTSLSRTGNNVVDLLTVHNTAANALVGTSTGSGCGVTGSHAGVATGAGFGVFGFSQNGPAVVGLTGTGGAGSTARVGVLGVGGSSSGSEVGVRGETRTNVGVFGVADATNPGGSAAPTGLIGMAGVAPNGIGVLGRSGADFSVGVWGQGGTGHGVVGLSNAKMGVLGWGGGSAVGVVADSAFSNGLQARTSSAMEFAALIQSQGASPANPGLLVHGTFVATGTKSAAVKTKKGVTLLYTVEACESLFEDVGTAKLANGGARVALDATFAETIEGKEYQVFLTPDGDCKGLYVANKDPSGFEVRELQAGTSETAFDWRVVGKRKDVPAGHRLATVPEPKALAPLDIEELERRARQ